MDGGHKGFLNAKFFMNDFGHGSQAVSCAGSIRDQVMLGGVIIFFIDSHDNGDIRVGSRSGNNDLFGTTQFDVLDGVRSLGIFTGRFDHHLHSQVLPLESG